MRIHWKRALFFTCRHLVLLSFLFGCGSGSDKTDPEPGPSIGSKKEKVPSTHVVATVDGTQILDAQVIDLVEAAENKLTVKEALEILIQTELLAKEAQRRGFDNAPEVTQARTIELTHAIFRKQVVDRFDLDSLDPEKIKKYYEQNKKRFVHGPMRRVRHFLAHTGKDQLDDKQALAAATQVGEITRDVKNEEEFKSLAKTVSQKDEYSGKARIEDLAPFEAETKKFVAPFVKATFAIPKVGQTSPPVKTSFGWHIIFFSEAVPPKNVPFEDVTLLLAQELLPRKRTFEAGHLFKSIYEKSDIFIYEDSLHDDVAAP
jgi:parvulin-like peptidyl-prolyl isomerase